jgi:hypothetical protein
MHLFGTLLLGHLIADFPLQTSTIFRFKRSHWAGVLLHSAVGCVVTAFLIEDPFLYWRVLLTLGLVHFAIDWLKLQFRLWPESLTFVADQIVHVLVLWLVARWVPQMQGVLSPVILSASLAYALVPVLLTFMWILVSDCAHYAVPVLERLQRAAPRLVLLSQLAGLPLVAMVAMAGLMGTGGIL